jgi:hypothetical protein
MIRGITNQPPPKTIMMSAEAMSGSYRRRPPAVTS